MPLIDDDTPQPKKVPITQNHIDTFVRQTAQLDAQMLAIQNAQRIYDEALQEVVDKANNGEELT